MTAHPRRLTYVAIAGALLLAASADARVTKITIDSKTALDNGAVYGPAGAYEVLRGTAYGEIDPTDRHNVGITDITLAPKNANDWCPNGVGRTAARSWIVWNVSHAFHASRGSLATSAERSLTAPGCHTTNRGVLPSPAAAKYASQSSPGALAEKSARVQ